jgi:hypothetical protein
MSELQNRALAAYFRSCASSGAIPQQPTTQEVTIDGLRYVVLRNVEGILAVYRVRVVNGQQVLKCLKRWPASLN